METTHIFIAVVQIILALFQYVIEKSDMNKIKLIKLIHYVKIK